MGWGSPVGRAYLKLSNSHSLKSSSKQFFIFSHHNLLSQVLGLGQSRPKPFFVHKSRTLQIRNHPLAQCLPKSKFCIPPCLFLLLPTRISATFFPFRKLTLNLKQGKRGKQKHESEQNILLWILEDGQFLAAPFIQFDRHTYFFFLFFFLFYFQRFDFPACA